MTRQMTLSDEANLNKDVMLSHIFVNRCAPYGNIGIKLSPFWYFTNNDHLEGFLHGNFKTLIFKCTKNGIPSLVLHAKEDTNGVYMIHNNEYFVSSTSTFYNLLHKKINGLVLRNIKLLPRKI